MPSLVWVLPFVAMLLAIALFPLQLRTAHWWEDNRNKLLVAVALGLVVLAYYGLRGFGMRIQEAGQPPHDTVAGFPTVMHVVHHSIVEEYFPFMVLLLSLYVISGGIQLRGDLRATPTTNTAFLGVGVMLANLIGTTGASMLLIRPLLQTNSERKHVRHTVIFFIFLVSNIGGCLLPMGDPPLFLGYLRGVPFQWTLRLAPEWLFTAGILLVIYYIWDSQVYRKQETLLDITLDMTRTEAVQVRGVINFVWLAGVVAAIALLNPGQPFPGTHWEVPPHLREVVQLVLAGLSLATTPRGLRREVSFNFVAIVEVACLFIGIFLTMQVPIEILKIQGPLLADRGFREPWHFFWATGMLSSFLDNAPTYVVFFETANTITPHEIPGHTVQLLTGEFILDAHLIAISLGAVFMGANSYIGNGPNFMVKSIAEQAGIKMPSFFGYMAYSMGILIPLFVMVTLVFL